MIIKALLDIQERHGYLPLEELEFLALRVNVPLHRIEEVTTFFPHFRREPPADVSVHICQSMTCHLRGAPGLLESARKLANREGSERLAVEGVSCLGRCDRAPVAFVSRHGGQGEHFHDHLFTGLDGARNLDRVLGEVLAGGNPEHDKDNHQPTRPAWQIDLYAPRQGAPALEPYAAVKKFLAGQLDGDKVISALEDADLVGMGGAAARTGKKWRDVRDAPGRTRYIICNADESEPGTFKDRELLLHTPYLIVEGMLLAGLTLGASRGYIYIRHEYHEQIEAARAAIEAARREVPEAMEACPLEVFVSPGLYICGEESALIEVIEGKRAQPRNQPPDIRNNGLFDQPTLVNNVETFAWVPSILVREPRDWYRNNPARFFSLSGDVKRPGVYEVSFRCTLGQLIEQAGGMREGLEFYAVAPSGPSGGFLPATLDANQGRALLDAGIPGLTRRSQLQGERVKAFRATLTRPTLSVLQMPLDVALFRTLELSLGAGVVVYGAKAGQRPSMLDHTRNLLQFFEKESCGKCVPCRLGCQQLAHFATQLQQPSPARLEGMPPVRDTVLELAQVMEITSICGLGRAASVPFTTWLSYFPDEMPASERTAPEKPR